MIAAPRADGRKFIPLFFSRVGDRYDPPGSWPPREELLLYNGECRTSDVQKKERARPAMTLIMHRVLGAVHLVVGIKEHHKDKTNLSTVR